jgi:hypothetical protein
MTDIVTVYHIYPEGCCDDYRYVLTNEMSDIDRKGVTISYQERSPETQKYEAKDSISLGLEEAGIVYKLLGKLLTGEA